MTSRTSSRSSAPCRFWFGTDVPVPGAGSFFNRARAVRATVKQTGWLAGLGKVVSQLIRNPSALRSIAATLGNCVRWYGLRGCRDSILRSSRDHGPNPRFRAEEVKGLAQGHMTGKAVSHGSPSFLAAAAGGLQATKYPPPRVSRSPCEREQEPEGPAAGTLSAP